MVCMYHVFLIHLSVDGHLNCFHFLAIVKDSVLKTLSSKDCQGGSHFFKLVIDSMESFRPRQACEQVLLLLCLSFQTYKPQKGSARGPMGDVQGFLRIPVRVASLCDSDAVTACQDCAHHSQLHFLIPCPRSKYHCEVNIIVFIV